MEGSSWQRWLSMYVGSWILGHLMPKDLDTNPLIVNFFSISLTFCLTFIFFYSPVSIAMALFYAYTLKHIVARAATIKLLSGSFKERIDEATVQSKQHVQHNWNEKFINLPSLPWKSENFGAIYLAQPGLTAGRLMKSMCNESSTICFV